MCGIAGLIGRLPSVPLCTEPDATIGHMIASLAHRGPVGSGTWQCPDGTVHLGHRRPAVLDLSPAAAQRFTSSSDTEVLLAGYRCWGPGIIDRQSLGAHAGPRRPC
jgi:asparagine synthase (glutamine-hydrolysing)